MKMYLKKLYLFTAVCCFLVFLYVNTHLAYAEENPSLMRNFPKPEIMCGQNSISYIILPNSFGGAVYDRIGYYDALITDNYSTLCNFGDEIRVDFNATDKPDKIIMQYNPNTMFNPEQFDKKFYYCEHLEIEDGFVIKEDHVNPQNRDTMYYLTATWENGNSLEYAFLILTDENVVPIRETTGDPVYVYSPRPTKPITMSGLTIITADEADPAKPTITVSGVIVDPDDIIIPFVSATTTSCAVLIDGKQTAFDAYNIDGSNYFKLRDLAYALNGSAKQFEVGWDGENNAIMLTSDKPYTIMGSEMEGESADVKTATRTTSRIYLDGEQYGFDAYNIGGSNYFKLRDVGHALGFSVEWDGAGNTIVIDTNKEYMSN